MSSGSLIVIDHDPLFNAVLSAALSKRGYAVASAHSVGEAMGIIGRCRPQAAVLDINLGELSGLVLIPLLRAANPDCRIVVLTAYISAAIAQDAANFGAGDVLTKPADADAVAAALNGCTLASGASAKGIRRARKALRAHGGSLAAAARTLGTSRRPLLALQAREASWFN